MLGKREHKYPDSNKKPSEESKQKRPWNVVNPLLSQKADSIILDLCESHLVKMEEKLNETGIDYGLSIGIFNESSAVRDEKASSFERRMYNFGMPGSTERTEVNNMLEARIPHKKNTLLGIIEESQGKQARLSKDLPRSESRQKLLQSDIKMHSTAKNELDSDSRAPNTIIKTNLHNKNQRNNDTEGLKSALNTQSLQKEKQQLKKKVKSSCNSKMTSSRSVLMTLNPKESLNSLVNTQNINNLSEETIPAPNYSNSYSQLFKESVDDGAPIGVKPEIIKTEPIVVKRKRGRPPKNKIEPAKPQTAKATPKKAKRSSTNPTSPLRAPNPSEPEKSKDIEFEGIIFPLYQPCIPTTKQSKNAQKALTSELETTANPRLTQKNFSSSSDLEAVLEFKRRFLISQRKDGKYFLNGVDILLVSMVDPLEPQDRKYRCYLECDTKTKSTSRDKTTHPTRALIPDEDHHFPSVILHANLGLRAPNSQVQYTGNISTQMQSLWKRIHRGRLFE